MGSSCKIHSLCCFLFFPCLHGACNRSYIRSRSVTALPEGEEEGDGRQVWDQVLVPLSLLLSNSVESDSVGDLQLLHRPRLLAGAALLCSSSRAEACAQEPFRDLRQGQRWCGDSYGKLRRGYLEGRPVMCKYLSARLDSIRLGWIRIVQNRIG
mmetsp:Transcript_39117/g.123336  ORF Transcript_39117/g.123336 Transcript_39117/m.123336 type:complete len:154 (+) Transcript_39117:633-1094(+)